MQNDNLGKIHGLKEKYAALEAQLHNAHGKFRQVKLVANQRNQRLKSAVCDRKSLEEKVSRLKLKVAQLETRRLCLTWNELYPVDTLAMSVKRFSFFLGVKCNNTFLTLINFSDECDPSDGICENLIRYNNVSMADCRRYQERKTAENVAMALMDLTSKLGTSNRSQGMCLQRDGMGWDGVVGIQMYVRCDISMQQVRTLFGVSQTMVHNVVYAWANSLCVTLEKFFLVPTRVAPSRLPKERDK